MSFEVMKTCVILLKGLIKIKQAFLLTANESFLGESLFLKTFLQSFWNPVYTRNQREADLLSALFSHCFIKTLLNSSLFVKSVLIVIPCKALECNPYYTNKHDFRHNNYVLRNIRRDNLSPGQTETRKDKRL